MADIYPSMLTNVVITPEASAESLVRAECGWHVAPEITETMVVNGSGTRHLFLPTLRIKSILEVKVNNQIIDISNMDYDEGGILYHPSGVWPNRVGSVKVTLTHGFDPSAVAWIVKQIADRVAGGAPAGVERVTVGQRSVTYRDTAGTIALLATEQAALRPYKIERKAF